MSTSPGIHFRFAKKYLRRVRLSKFDPMLNCFKAKNFPFYKDPYNEDQVYIELAIESPIESKIYSENDLINQLEQ